jgi:nicotinamidase-related amidase
MTLEIPLLTPADSALVLIDVQAGLAFGVESIDRQTLLNNLVALARTASLFTLPTIVSASASKVYSGPMLPAVRAALPGIAVMERHNMNCWEDEAVKGAIIGSGRRRLIFAGMLTEACISFPVLSALEAGYDVYVAGDSCGGLTVRSHDLALRRMESAGAHMTSWIQVLLEMQRDWTRHATYEAARSIVVDNGGGYGIGLAYAREMIHPV